MGKEVERKFLVSGTAWRALAEADIRILQFYLATAPGRTVRIRISDGASARLTLKFGSGMRERDEFEYPIPLEDAEELVEFAVGRVIEKTRHHLALGPGEWTVDEFTGDNDGLVLAEIELGPDESLGAPPSWLGQDVTEDDRYANANLQVHPYTSW